MYFPLLETTQQIAPFLKEFSLLEIPCSPLPPPTLERKKSGHLYVCPWCCRNPLPFLLQTALSGPRYQAVEVIFPSRGNSFTWLDVPSVALEMPLACHVAELRKSISNPLNLLDSILWLHIESEKSAHSRKSVDVVLH